MEPCQFIRAWIGRCGATDPAKCKHRKEPCSCGRPATGECGETYQFVCGFNTCNGHRCHRCEERNHMPHKYGANA